MTAQQLRHLAALPGDAARYYQENHPAWARIKPAAARIARLAAAHQQRQEEAIPAGPLDAGNATPRWPATDASPSDSTRS